jgi:hypothetical protein
MSLCCKIRVSQDDDENLHLLVCYVTPDSNYLSSDRASHTRKLVSSFTPVSWLASNGRMLLSNEFRRIPKELATNYFKE